MKEPEGRRPPLAGELIVPGLMAAFLVSYWWQAAALSAEALVFPAALSAVLVALLLGQIYPLFRAWRAGAPAVARPTLSLAAVQRLALLVLSVVLLTFWREIGGTLVIFGFTIAALLILGERRLWLLVVLPVLFSASLSYLFKVVLRVRFPDGLFGPF